MFADVMRFFTGYAYFIWGLHMATYKVSILWNGVNRGFSETWYYAANNLLNDADRGRISEMAYARAGLVATQYSVQAIRVSDVATPRVSELLPGGMRGKALGNVVATDNPTSAWLMRAGTATGPKRPIYLRGIWDEWTKYEVGEEAFLLQAGMAERFGRWKAIMVSPVGNPALSPWRIRVVAPINDVNALTRRITTIDVDLLNRVKLTISAAAAWDEDRPIIMSGWRKPYSYLNGTYSALQWSKATLAVTLDKPVAAFISQASPESLRLRAQIVSYLGLTSMEPVRIGSRKTGRAFFVPAGHR